MNINFGKTHPAEEELMLVVRSSPADPRTWTIRLHIAICSNCQEQVVNCEAELLRLWALIEFLRIPRLSMKQSAGNVS